MQKMIRISEEAHNKLCNIGSKKDTFNDIILKLINEHYNYEETITDKQAVEYNKLINQLEAGDTSNTTKINDTNNIINELLD